MENVEKINWKQIPEGLRNIIIEAFKRNNLNRTFVKYAKIVRGEKLIIDAPCFEGASEYFIPVQMKDGFTAGNQIGRHGWESDSPQGYWEGVAKNAEGTVPSGCLMISIYRYMDTVRVTFYVASDAVLEGAEITKALPPIFSTKALTDYEELNPRAEKVLPDLENIEKGLSFVPPVVTPHNPSHKSDFAYNVAVQAHNSPQILHAKLAEMRRFGNQYSVLKAFHDFPIGDSRFIELDTKLVAWGYTPDEDITITVGKLTDDQLTELAGMTKFVLIPMTADLYVENVKVLFPDSVNIILAPVEVDVEKVKEADQILSIAKSEEATITDYQKYLEYCAPILLPMYQSGKPSSEFEAEIKKMLTGYPEITGYIKSYKSPWGFSFSAPEPIIMCCWKHGKKVCMSIYNPKDKTVRLAYTEIKS